MKKLIRSQKEVTIDELVEMLIHRNETVVVFYHSNNKRDGTPKFLKKDCKGNFGFISPFYNNNATYATNCIIDTLGLASASRQIFVAEKTELSKIFKINQEL